MHSNHSDIKTPIPILVTLVGLIQLVHISFLFHDGLNFFRGLSEFRLAPAPSGGWTAPDVLISLGTIDFVVAGLTLLFVFLYFKNVAWAPILGIMVLGVAHITGLVYIIVVLRTDAFMLHPLAYGVICLLFVPFELLTIYLIRDFYIKARA